MWALEIKWSNRYFETPGELKSLLTFCETNNLKSALVTTIDKTGSREMQKMKLHFCNLIINVSVLIDLITPPG